MYTLDPRVARGMRRVRIERGWTLEDVAALLKCHPSKVSRIENGERGTPDPAIIARILGVSVGYLLMPCPRCAERPPAGYMCLRCGTCRLGERYELSEGR
jgi:transcriptional regulator with XRE-family HTH domain